MWPFTRKPQATGAAEPASVTPLMHFDWKGLPPIQRSIADHPLTVPTESFASDLVTHEDPRAIAQPLGHHVSLEAPPGIVLGIARPETRSEGPALIARTRSAHRAPALQRVIDESVAGEAELPEVERMEEEQASPPVVPLRRLAASREPLPSVQLTRVTDETAPTPLAPEVVTHEEPPASAAEAEPSLDATTTEVPSYPRLTLGQARRLGLGAPISRVPGTATSVQRVSEVSTRPELHRESRPSEPEAPKFQTFELDYLVNTKPEVVAPAPISRPQRIPLPVSRSIEPEPARELTRPPTAVEQSTTADLSTAASAQAPGPVQRWAEPEAAEEAPVQRSLMAPDETPIGEIAGPPAIASAADPRRMVLTDAPKGEAHGSEGEAEPPLALALAAPREQAAITTTEVGPAPNLVSVAAESAAAPSTTSPAAPAPLTHSGPLAPLVSVRAPLLTHPVSAVARAVQRTPEGAPSSVQRAPEEAPSVQPVARDAPRTVRTVASVDAPTLPSESSVISTDAPFFAVPSLPEAGVAPTLPLAREPRHADATPLQRAASTPSPFTPGSWPSVPSATAVLERTVDEAEPTWPSIQRAAEWTVSAAADDTSGTSLVQAGEAPPGAPGGNDDEQMEHLAAKLYDRIRGRLRNELLVDRERAGFLTDLR